MVQPRGACMAKLCDPASDTDSCRTGENKRLIKPEKAASAAETYEEIKNSKTFFLPLRGHPKLLSALHRGLHSDPWRAWLKLITAAILCVM